MCLLGNIFNCRCCVFQYVLWQQEVAYGIVSKINYDLHVYSNEEDVRQYNSIAH